MSSFDWKNLIIYVIVNDIVNSLLITGHGHYVSVMLNASYDGLRKTRMHSVTPVSKGLQIRRAFI